MPFCFMGVMEALAGKRSAVVDPFETIIEMSSEDELAEVYSGEGGASKIEPSLDQENAIKRWKSIHSKYWKL